MNSSNVHPAEIIFSTGTSEETLVARDSDNQG